MCMNIIFNVSSPLLPQFPSISSCTKSWSQSLLHIIIASFNSSLSHCCLIFTNFSFNFQNRTCTEILLHCEVHEFSFPTSPHSPKTDSEQESYGRMRTRWKGKFVYFAMEQYFSTCSVLEIERKIREDEAAMGQRGIEGGDNDVKQ